MSEIKTSIRIKSLDLISFKIESTSDKFDPSNVNFKMTYDLHVTANWSEARFNLPIEIYKDKTEKDPLCSIHTRGEFLLDINAPKELDKKKIDFPVQLAAILFGTLYSTTRGMLLMLSKGTPLEKIYLPIINANEFFKNLKPIKAEKTTHNKK